MSYSLRRFAPVVVLACVGLTAGCESNNKGKIEGKWKMVSLPEKVTKDKGGIDDLAKLGMYVYWEFKPDGVLTFGVGADRPETLELVKKGAPNQKFVWDAKYKLLSGDLVELYDIPKDMQQSGGGGMFGSKDRGRAKVKITGDDMTMTDDTGTMKLVRTK
ncbi:hypothetical protein [Frigoriglobus tundricola]|uniref:Lipocalin-like domain-containing protein n=1 Tax=Frigoriglobus tundricola TaxID=2774151 RepID=A0A6M5Z2I3_9BACT|nr:hypothetical protein [Frigoriglobus tundricola]QJW99651.1 hypothetical protein FTUN_7270 [Frigoriglobus tundricola]